MCAPFYGQFPAPSVATRRARRALSGEQVKIDVDMCSIPRRGGVTRSLGALLVAALATASAASAAPWPGSAATHPGRGPTHLTVARERRALPLNLLIAQAGGRVVSISPRGQVVWGLRQADPTQVFVTRTGRTLIVAEANRGTVAMRRIDDRRVSYSYRALASPRTALETANGELVVADAGRCEIVFLSPARARPVETLGAQDRCSHRPPAGFASPVAAFPSAGGELVVTERGWIDVLSARGALMRAIALHGLRRPADANAYGADGLIVADQSNPGRVEELDRVTGAVRWSYGPHSGRGRLDRPALATVLADGAVLVVDSGNDRVIVIDRRTKRIVWQYGHSGVAASRPGYLDDPRSAVLVPLGR